MKELVLKDVSPTDLRLTLEKMGMIVDPVTGIIRSIMANPNEQGDASIFAFGAIACQASPLSIGTQIVHAGGAAVARDQAIAATIGEAIERYCAAYSDPAEHVFSAFSDFKDEAIHPSQFSLYSDRQYSSPDFPFERFTETTKLTWTWGYSLQQKKPVLVPASQTYFPFYSETQQSSGLEADIGNTVTTGLACGNTIEEAILSGIGEVVERDSLTCFWMNRLPPRRVVIDEASPLFETFREKFALDGLQYYVCEMTTDLEIPAFLTLLIGGSNYGLMVNVGSCSALSPARAALKSLVEAAHGRPYVRFILQAESGWSYSPDFSTVNTFRDHAAFYTRAPRHHNVLDFITHSEPVKSLSKVPDLSTGSIRGDLRLCLDLLAKHHLDVIVKDLTSPDIEELSLKVVRVSAIIASLI
jgi:ribosomal protein S12 methylthiotransferase accessory factor